jgi:GrpB-like predicted nucleotidyltransferase (UPF0157 family)
MAKLDGDDLIAAATVGELKPYAVQVVLEDYNPDWPAWYAADESAIRAALGDLVLRIEHTGSTSVPGLAAKPIIDILLLVPDSADEPGYVPPLERLGYTLRIREPDWYEHRCLNQRAENGAPHSINLHVFSPNRAAPEIRRMLAFRDHLRAHPDDRAYYERTKRQLAQRNWKYVQHYANAKSDVVEEILTRALHGRSG